jgi:hypothetical protein
MSRPFGGTGVVLAVYCLAVGLTCGGSTPAAAQSVSLSAEPALGSYFKPNHWVPITIWLDNQGQTADVEISAELKEIRGGPGPEFRLKVEQLPAPSRRRYTLYVLPGASYSSQPLEVQLIQGRRVVGQQTVDLRPMSTGDRIVAVLDREQGSLNMLSGLQLPSPRADPFNGYPGRRPPGQRNTSQVQVGYLKPEACPDRCRGFDAVDLLVIGNVSASELSEAQKKAITEWVGTGGTLVIAGGANGMRLADPFFRELLPVQVSGTLSIPRLVGMQRFSFKQAPPTGQFVITQATLKPGATILATADAARLPLVVEGRSGAGRVLFLAFDYSRPPVRMWEGTPEMWGKFLLTARSPILEQVDPRTDYSWRGGWQQGRWRVGNACHALSQMDPPRFAWIGLFLVSYIIVLVPVNYFVLKQRDRREYAWLTTPGIVLVFSLLAYVVGFAMKGGQVLLAKVAVVEADAGSPVAAAYHYIGLFSPRKTAYDVAAPGANGTLAEWREESGTPRRPVSIVESEPFRAEDMSVDMWSMRILRLENTLPLGQGVTAELSREATSLSGTVTNHTPYDLEECSVLFGAQTAKIGKLARGATLVIPPIAGLGSGGSRGSLLPSSIAGVGAGDTALDRIKRAMVQPLTSNAYNAAPLSLEGPVLIGWAMRPLVNVTVNGRRSRELNVGLFVIHLR